jgi:PAS domain S-box-containing protein
MPTKERDIILDSITEGVFTVDRNWHITSFNRVAETITGIPRDMAIGQPCKDILRANICERNCALRETIDTGKLIVGKAAAIVDRDGNRRPNQYLHCRAKEKDKPGRIAMSVGMGKGTLEKSKKGYSINFSL